MSTGSSSRKTGRTRNEEKVSLFKYLRSSLHCGLGFSIPFSLIMYLFTVYVIGIPVLLYDTVILQIYFLIISVIMFLFAATILWLPGVGIDRLISKAGRVFGLVPLFTVILSVPVVFLILLSGWVLIDRPFDFSSPWFIPVCIAFCVVGVGVGFMLKDTALGIKRLFRGAGLARSTGNFFLFILLSIIVAVLIHVGSGLRNRGSRAAIAPTASREETATRLVIIGLDGATLDIMESMIADGELPNIKYLMDNGTYGPLASNVSMTQAFASSASMGMRSPALWESVATGKVEKKHGILDFSVMRVPFMKSDFPFRIPFFDGLLETIPTTSTVGKSLRYWDILSRAGVDVGILGWWNLWPVRPVDNGYVVSSRIRWADMEKALYPEDLLEEYPKDEYFTDEKPVKLFLNRWEGLTIDSLRTILHTSDINQNFDEFRRHFKRDNFIAALGLYLMKDHPTPLFATYFSGPDFVCHLFWKHMEPTLFEGVREEDAKLFGDIIFKYYSFLDEVVGKHVEVYGLDATYIILSDHGFGVWHEDEPGVIRDMYHPTYSGKHRKEGIIIMAGKNIKRGIQLDNPELFDITPTVLTLFGMPVALDMDGRPLTEAIEDGFMQAHPVRYVNTYESGERRVPVAVSSRVDDEIKERLKALGYLD